MDIYNKIDSDLNIKMDIGRVVTIMRVMIMVLSTKPNRIIT